MAEGDRRPRCEPLSRAGGKGCHSEVELGVHISFILSFSCLEKYRTGSFSQIPRTCLAALGEAQPGHKSCVLLSGPCPLLPDWAGAGRLPGVQNGSPGPRGQRRALIFTTTSAKPSSAQGQHRGRGAAICLPRLLEESWARNWDMSSLGGHEQAMGPLTLLQQSFPICKLGIITTPVLLSPGLCEAS